MRKICICAAGTHFCKHYKYVQNHWLQLNSFLEAINEKLNDKKAELAFFFYLLGSSGLLPFQSLSFDFFLGSLLNEYIRESLSFTLKSCSNCEEHLGLPPAAVAPSL